MKRLKVEVPTDQNVSASGVLKIIIKEFEDWKPFNMYYGCQGQLYYELDGFLWVVRDPINNPTEAKKVRPL